MKHKGMETILIAYCSHRFAIPMESTWHTVRIVKTPI